MPTKIIHNGVEEFFLFLRGANLHVHSVNINSVTKLEKSEYISILSKYIKHDVFYKPLEDLDIK